MIMDASLRKGNCKSDQSSSLKKNAEKLGDCSILGNSTSEPAVQEPNAAPKLDMSPSDANFVSASDISGKLGFSSPRPDALLNNNGGVDNGNVNHNQITVAEADQNLQTVPVEAGHMGSGAEVCEKTNFSPPSPHSLLIDQVVMHTEVHKLELELDVKSKFVNTESTNSDHHRHTVGIDTQRELKESDILIENLTSFSEDASRNVNESMHSEENKRDLKIGPQTKVEESGSREPVILADKPTSPTSHFGNVSSSFVKSIHNEERKYPRAICQSKLETFFKKGSQVSAQEPSKVLEDETRKHIGTSSDGKVSSAAKHMESQNERLVYEPDIGNLESVPPSKLKSPNPELLEPTVVNATENASNTGVGCEESSLFVAGDALDMHPETILTNVEHVHLVPPHPNGKNTDLLVPAEKAAIEISGQPETVDEGSHIQGKRRKSTAQTAAASARILRSRSKEKPEVPLPSNVAAEVSEAARKKRKIKRKQMKDTPVSEFSRMKNHLRYLLQRIRNEWNLIDAYSSEGWRRQSLDKIKPEKELQLAKSRILRYKLKIRELFHRLDVSLTEGQIPETLFDSEGEIDSEDIFCAKCASKDVSLDNDIILCDGACERGYHQFCLEPPLHKEDIPQGDDGWLCPGCDCKDDCIDLLNDFNGTKLSVLDNWEKVFPEADPAVSGKTLEDGSALPSDDSDDDDYDPDRTKVDEELPDQETSSDDSDYLSASGASSGSPAKPGSPTKEHFRSLPSDDSEDDDDFDPNAPDDDDSDNDKVKEESSSDFTSDSEDLGAVLEDNTSIGDDQVQSHSDGDKLEMNVRVNRQSLKDEISYLLNSNKSPISAKRHVQRLDYKKLHDESYGNGNELSDSSDEDFEVNVGLKRKRNISGKGSASAGNESDSRPEDGGPEKRSAKQAKKQFDTKDGNKSSTSHASSSEAGSGKSRSKPPQKLEEAVTQRLLESFKKSQYLKRAEKEDLARELGLTIQQVSKWFENARRSSRQSATMESKGTPGSSKGQTHAKDKLNDEGQQIETEVALSNENTTAASPGASLTAKLTQTVDVVVEPLITEEAGKQKSEKQKSETLNSKKRKNKKDGQPPSSSGKKLEGNSQVDSPGSQGLRRSSRRQSASNAGP